MLNKSDDTEMIMQATFMLAKQRHLEFVTPELTLASLTTLEEVEHLFHVLNQAPARAPTASSAFPPVRLYATVGAAPACRLIPDSSCVYSFDFDSQHVRQHDRAAFDIAVPADLHQCVGPAG